MAGTFDISDIFDEMPATPSLPKKGKARSRALKKALEKTPILPAIKHPKTGSVTRGLPGETHYNVIEREAAKRGIKDDYNKVDDLIDEYFKPKKGGAPGEFNESTGFYHARTGEYMTRDEAAKRLREKVGSGTGESRAAMVAQMQVNPKVALAETRRGVGEEAARLLAKRKQTGRILHGLNERIAKTASNPSAVAKLLNRRGVVRSIARKNRYLGLALAAGEAIKSYYEGSQ